jgi:hypothetical protein
LVGLAGSAGMFNGDESGNETKHLRRPALRLEQNFFVGNELLGGGRDRPFPDDCYLRNLKNFLVRVVGQRLIGIQHDKQTHK